MTKNTTNMDEDEAEVMEVLEVLDVIDMVENGLPRQINIRQNFFDTMDDVTFRRRFRLSKQCALQVLARIERHLEYPTDVNNSVSPINQLLTCLRVYSTGGHLDTVADLMGMHLSTASRTVGRVSQALARLYHEEIKLPDTQDAIRKVQQEFFDIATFPQVIGAIDCTHIKVQSPGGEDAEIFRNRKGYFSLNTQMICDSQLRITNVVARWPGSVHDSTIFSNSRVKRRIERDDRYRNCLLLGDSGYPNKTYLFTPVLAPMTHGENQYNQRHIQTRNTIERCFGVIKRRFPILAYGCRLKIQTVQIVIVASAVLHNIALTMGEDEPPPLPEELYEHQLNILIANGQIPNLNVYQDNVIGGNAARRQLITEYFQRL